MFLSAASRPATVSASEWVSSCGSLGVAPALGFIVSNFHFVRPFGSSRLKLSRARHHIASIQAEMSAFMAARPLKAVHEAVPTNPNFVWFNLTREAPQVIPAIIGDVIHNLRSALDVMMCDMVRLETGQDDVSGVYFPFASDAVELEKMIIKRRVHLAGQHVVDLVRSFAPYKGGNLALRRIHDLDIVDKHTSIIQVACMFTYPDQGSIGNTLSLLTPKDRLWGFGAKSAAGVCDICNSQPIFDCLFDFLEGPFEGPTLNDPVVETLQGLVQDVTGITDAFETLCLGAVSE